MQYDAVLLYANSEHPHYDWYLLPQRPVSNAEGEEFRFPRRLICDVIESKIHTIYMQTDPKNWTCLEDGAAGRWIDPISYSGGNE